MPRSKATDATEVRALLEWAAANGVMLTSVSIGACAVTLQPRIVHTAPPRTGVVPTSIYQQFGGEHLKEVGDVVGDEYVPAVGRR